MVNSAGAITEQARAEVNAPNASAKVTWSQGGACKGDEIYCSEKPVVVLLSSLTWRLI